jgi:hypothetical protein
MTTDTVLRKLCQSPQTNLRCIFERTQIQLDWIFCEFSQTQTYWMFVNARRTNLQEALLKPTDPNLRDPDFRDTFECRQTQIHSILVNSSRSSYTSLSANIHKPKFGKTL